MGTVPSINKLAALSGPGSFDFGDIMLLNQLRVLDRMKRYSRRYYVNFDTDIGRDGKRGDSSGVPFDRPLNTLGAALALAEDGRGDFIILQSTGEVSVEKDVSIAKSDLTIVGMDSPLAGVGGFTPATAVTAAILSVTSAGDNLLLKRLKFDTTAALRAAITVASGAHNLIVEDCFFKLVGAASADIGYGIKMAAAVTMPVIRRNTFYVGTLVQEVMKVYAGATGGLIEGNVIVNLLNASGVGCVIAIDIATGTGVVVKGNHIHGGPTAISAFNFGSGITIASGVLNTILTGPNYAGFCDDVATNCVTDGGTSTIGVTSGTVKLT